MATSFTFQLIAEVNVGIERLFTDEYASLLRGKRIGLITNQTAVDHKMESTIDLLKRHAADGGYKVTALFAPEHGLTGIQYASAEVLHQQDADGIPIYSLHGSSRRATPEMLQNIDILIYDIQDIGSRSYTYISTLFYAMEEAVKRKLTVVVLDRPNPINGLVVNGPMLEEQLRSFVGYINVPYCHGMTIGELALFFNAEYQINCPLVVVKMSGWKREMSFPQTGLPWVPTSPNIPEPTTPLYYPMTGILGELQIVSIGIGYSLPFKIVGAPWIDAKQFAESLNAQRFPGVLFSPFYYRPFFGRFAHEDCQGVLITVTNPRLYQPVAIQYLLIGMLKNLYPIPFLQALDAAKDRLAMFNKVNGTEKVYRILRDEKYTVWKLKALHEKERAVFQTKRLKYLLYQ